MSLTERLNTLLERHNLVNENAICEGMLDIQLCTLLETLYLQNKNNMYAFEQAYTGFTRIYDVVKHIHDQFLMPIYPILQEYKVLIKIEKWLYNNNHTNTTSFCPYGDDENYMRIYGQCNFVITNRLGEITSHDCKKQRVYCSLHTKCDADMVNMYTIKAAVPYLYRHYRIKEIANHWCPENV